MCMWWIGVNDVAVRVECPLVFRMVLSTFWLPLECYNKLTCGLKWLLLFLRNTSFKLVFLAKVFVVVHRLLRFPVYSKTVWPYPSIFTRAVIDISAHRTVFQLEASSLSFILRSE